MKSTKIDWCDCTINPVVGCTNNCAYCYARKLNERFHFIENWNEPQFFPERLKQLNSKKPKSVFVNSMSDIADWTEEQVVALFRAMIKNPQHRYIALTKDYDSWLFLYDDAINHYEDDFSILQKIFFVGRTATNQYDLDRCYKQADFISIEPMLDEIESITLGSELFWDDTLLGKAIIVGAETGNRKNKVVPKKEWINKLVEQADEWDIPIFMKESLRPIMGKDFRQDKLIWEINK